MHSKKKRVIGIGEVLIDRFPGYVKPGGAPANVVYNLNKLGNHGILVSAVGNDDNGNVLRNFLHDQAIPVEYIQESEKPTGTVDITFEGGEARYEITTDVAWDAIQWTDELKQLSIEAHAICFSSLCQRSAISAKTIHQFLDAAKPEVLRVLDINLRPPFINTDILRESFKRAHLVKLNAHEYHMVADIFNTPETSTFLFESFGVKAIILTLGDKGSAYITPGHHLECKSNPVDIRNGDSVGVGDAFIACIIHHMLKGSPPHLMLEKANQYAGYVATQTGAMVNITPQLLEQTS